jgi:hypothetical protein
MLKRLICSPFQAGIGIYIILNALLTFNPNSAVLMNLWQIIGGYSLAAVCFQILAGSFILAGMVTEKINIEAAGLVMACSTLSIRAFALLSDKEFTLSDINTTCLVALMIVASTTRIITMTRKICSSKD